MSHSILMDGNGRMPHGVRWAICLDLVDLVAVGESQLFGESPGMLLGEYLFQSILEDERSMDVDR